MEYEEYKEKVIDVVPDSEGLLYRLAIVWLKANRLPLSVIGLGNCTDTILKIPNISKEERVIQWSSGPRKMVGPRVPVITFAKNVFYGNTNITDIILPSNIYSIPQGAFSGCSNLKRITIPKKVGYIGEGTFKGCDCLEDVYYEGSEEEWQKVNIVHKGSKPKEPEKLGLYIEIEHFDIPGNEALLNASIHYNCTLNGEVKNELHNDNTSR